MKKIFFPAILIALILQIVFAANISKDKTDVNFNDFISYFYNRYSKNFDDFGFVYSVPDYGKKAFTAPYYPREIISLASYYKYRAINNDIKAQDTLRINIENTISHFYGQFKHAPSFEDAEALLLMVSIDQQLPNLLNLETKTQLNNLIKEQINLGIQAPDTENRAIVSAGHWQFLINYLFEKKLITAENKKTYDQNIKEKIDKAIKESISADGWYRETNIVPHYQAVSAFMLLMYGQLSNQNEYLILAKEMYLNLKILSCNNGAIESQIGHRPIGLGAQFYFMMAAMGKSFNDNDYFTYLNQINGNRFFSDSQHPNRLEYHRTAYKLNSKELFYATENFHDDYAFSDAVEMAIINNIFKDNEKIKNLATLQNPLTYKNDNDVEIINKKNTILIQDKITKQQIKIYCETDKNLIIKERF